MLGGETSRHTDMIWSYVTDAGAVITILGLPYLVVSNRRRTPKFSFSFAGSSREQFQLDNMEFCRMKFSGTIRNQSSDPNSIEKIHLVVWSNRKKKGTRTFGHIPTEILEHGNPITLPIPFEPRQGRQIDLTYEVVLTGTHEKELVSALQPLPASVPGTPPGQILYLPKYTYELAFEDTIGNLFDQAGLPRNRAEIDLRWTLENTFRDLKEGHPWPFVRHSLKIVLTRGTFSVRRAIRRLGL
jgi:hypothetical protein